MKKILLSAVAFLAFSAVNAQIYEANDSAAFSLWSAYDLDNDGNNFAAFEDLNGASAVSYSYDNATGALTPDNLFASPAIDLTTGSNIMLNWKVTAIDPNWVSEKYAIYVVTDVTALIISGTFPPPVHVETLPSSGILDRSVDISALADGQPTVHIVIRHYESTDWFAIGFDDLTITGDFVSVEENNLSVLNVYPNPAVDELNITLNEAASSVSIMTLDGKIISTNNEVNSINPVISVADLAAGMYLYEVTTKDGRKVRNSFVKQ